MLSNRVLIPLQRFKKSHTVLITMVVLNASVAVTGFGKDLSTTAYLGTTALADAYAAAYFIVDTAVNVLSTATNVAGAARFGPLAGLTPTHEYARIVGRTLATLMAVALGLSVFLLLMRGWLLAPFSQLTWLRADMNAVYVVLLPFLVFYTGYSLISAGLQAKQRFTASVAAPNVLNIIVVGAVATLLITHREAGQGAIWLASAVSFGSLMMFAVVYIVWKNLRPQFKDAPRSVERSRFTSTPAHVLRLTLSYSCYLALLQIVGFVERYAAVHLQSGSVAAVSYAYRIAQLPNWIFISAIGTLALPTFAADINLKEWASARDLVRRCCAICFLVTVPASILFIVLNRPIVQVLFEHGAFDARSVSLTATFLRGYAFATVAQCFSLLLARLSTAIGSMLVPILATGVAAATTAAWDLLLTPRIGPLALGLGALIGAVISSVFLLINVRNVVNLHVAMPWGLTVRFLAGNGITVLAAVVVSKLYAGHLFDHGSSGAFERTVFLLCSLVLILCLYLWVFVVLRPSRGRGKTRAV